MNLDAVEKQIVNWLTSYCEQAAMTGFIVGISGGIDSALCSTLCALSGKTTVCMNLPLRQRTDEYLRAKEHIENLEQRFSNVKTYELDLSNVFSEFEMLVPEHVSTHPLAMANTRARLRMTTLYAVGQSENLLVAGTGNKIEDFGIGFFTKYGDGGVDISPIADLYKTEVFELAKHLGVINSILNAKPTDGLWEDGRNDEDQIGASYAELEWAMKNTDIELSECTQREQEVLTIYKRLNKVNQHKMLPIPICKIDRG